MRSISFYNGGFYHVFNRGVDKRIVFGEENEYNRFLTSVDKFRIIKSSYQKTEKLVKIVAFCLMPNHYHLLLQQLKDNGVSTFMHRLGIGYTLYFNYKYKRSGSLFESQYKVNEVQDDSQFLHISRYIHLNPVDLIEQKNQWNRKYVKDFLRRYRWSSFRHYIGVEKFDFIDEKPVMRLFDSIEDYESFLLDWLPHRFALKNQD